MRCYFNLADGQEMIWDREGLELSDLAGLEARVVKAIVEAAQEVGSDAFEGWRLEVADSAGAVLMVIPLDRALLA